MGKMLDVNNEFISEDSTEVLLRYAWHTERDAVEYKMVRIRDVR